MHQVRSIFIAFFLLQCLSVSAQSKLLIFARGEDYLLPFIKQTLEELEDYRSKKKIFSVTNFNLLLDNSAYDLLFRKYVYNIDPQQSFGTGNDSLNIALVDSALGQQYILFIKENVLQDKIEFQFYLTDVVKDSATLKSAKNAVNSNRPFPVTNILHPTAENNFFIDLSSPEYLSVLSNGIKRLISNSNSPTQFDYSPKGNVVMKDKTNYHIRTGDSVDVQIDKAFDEDTNVENIVFKVGVVPVGEIASTSFVYSLIQLSPTQFRIKTFQDGQYKLIVTANDGVDTYRSDTVNLSSITTPVIYVKSDAIRFAHTKGLLNEKKKLPFRGVVMNDPDRKVVMEILSNNDILPLATSQLDELIKKHSNFLAGLGSREKKTTTPVPKMDPRIDERISMSWNGSVTSLDKELNITGKYEGLRTNMITIPINRKLSSSFAYLVGASFNNPKMISTYCTTCADSTIEARSYQFGVEVMGYLTNNIAVNASLYLPLTHFRQTNRAAFNDVKEMGANFGVGASYVRHTLTSKFIYDYGIHGYFLFQSLRFSDKSGPVGKEILNYTLMPGLGGFFRIMPLRNKELGFFVQAKYFKGSNKDFRLTSKNIYAGILIQPLLD